MRARRIGLLALTALLLGAAPDELAEQRRRLAEAKAQAAVAAERSDVLEHAAAAERDAATRARAERAAVASRVAAAEADLAAADARVSLVDRLLADRRAALAARQAPVTRLLAALEALARRPAVVAIAQPGSIDDLVHVRAVLGGALPVIAARTAGLREDLARTRVLADDAALAATALADSRTALARRREALAALATGYEARSAALVRDALAQSDRAIALGERARDLVEAIEERGGQQATAADLARLPGPLMPVAGQSPAPPAYRLPIAGRLVTGLGEVSDAGVRARGLTLAVAPGATVVAPAGGRIAYAGRFRSFGTIVVIDHGDGWSTLVTGLAAAVVRPGDTVAAGGAIGRTGGDEPRVTVELRRRGRPVDITALL